MLSIYVKNKKTHLKHKFQKFNFLIKKAFLVQIKRGLKNVQKEYQSSAHIVIRGSMDVLMQLL